MQLRATAPSAPALPGRPSTHGLGPPPSGLYTPEARQSPALPASVGASGARDHALGFYSKLHVPRRMPLPHPQLVLKLSPSSKPTVLSSAAALNRKSPLTQILKYLRRRCSGEICRLHQHFGLSPCSPAPTQVAVEVDSSASFLGRAKPSPALRYGSVRCWLSPAPHLPPIRNHCTRVPPKDCAFAQLIRQPGNPPL